MRFKFLYLFGSLVLSACSFQVDVLEPRSTNTVLPAAPGTFSTSTATPPVITSTPTETPFPTDSPSPLTPVTQVSTNSSSIVPIVFRPNATAETVAGNIAGGASQIFSLEAFEGQVMSVSILPEKPELQNTFQLQITGSNGAVLCPIKDYTCPFWRGALPSTQEYLIEVIAQSSGAFRMQVAINPPGTVSQTFAYSDPQGRFALSYPDDFAPAHYTGAQITKIPPDFSLQYIDTQQFLSTNLSEVYLLVGVSDDEQQVSSCIQPPSFGGQEQILGEAAVDGATFTKSEGGGVAAGNIYEQVYYRTLHNGSCYEVTYFVHYGNIGNYPPGAVNEFDRTSLYQELDEILATLVLK